MRYHLYQKFFVKMVKIKEMSFLFTRGMGLMYGNCMHTQSFAILVLTQVNFTKQNGLKIGSWMECRKNMIEHTHFKKKKVEKVFKKLIIKEI